MGHDATDCKHVDTMMTECARHGFHPFHVKKPSMGYIYNRYEKYGGFVAYSMVANLETGFGLPSRERRCLQRRKVLPPPKKSMRFSKACSRRREAPLSRWISSVLMLCLILSATTHRPDKEFRSYRRHICSTLLKRETLVLKAALDSTITLLRAFRKQYIL